MNPLRKQLEEYQAEWDEIVHRMNTQPGMCKTEIDTLRNRLWGLDKSMKNVEAQIRAENCAKRMERDLREKRNDGQAGKT
jgi:hypothetical protein